MLNNLLNIAQLENNQIGAGFSSALSIYLLSLANHLLNIYDDTQEIIQTVMKLGY